MNKLLEVKNLNISYKKSKVRIKDINFSLNEKEIISIVGESGSGKTTVIRSILGLLPEGANIDNGEIIFFEKNLLKLERKALKKIIGKELAMIFQDPGSTLDPIKTIQKQFIEYILEHQNLSKNEAIQLAKEELKKLNLKDVDRIMSSYPYELSGGMKQRIAIAMVMAQKPKLLLADEPTSALDVSTQAQVIKELEKIKNDYNTTILLVTHNIALASHISDRIIVMKDGKIIETNNKEEIIKFPKNEYTKLLINSVINLE